MSRNLNKAPSIRTNSKRIESGLISTLISSFCILPNRFAVITPECEQFFKTKNYEAFKRKINRQNWKLQNRYVKDLVLRENLEKQKCALVFIPKNGKQVTSDLEAAFALMGGQNTAEEGRVLPSDALLSFFDNGLKYFPPGYDIQAWSAPSYASNNVTGTTASTIPSTISSSESMDESVGESDSSCENEQSFVEEILTMQDLLAQTPTVASSYYLPPQQCSDEVYTSYDDELSECSSSPRALVPLDEKGVMGNEVVMNRPSDCLPETFEEFFASNQLTFDSETNSLSHHGYPHSF
jgi:hypothetical protein